MFDELDEGTQLLNAVDSPPAQAAGDIGYEGLPSDVYLCWAGKGTQMMRGELPYNATKPDCAALTQPTIPTALPTMAPGQAREGGLVLRWAAAMALAGGGEVSHYEVLLDGVVRRTSDASITGIRLSPGHLAGDASTPHQWRVRAVSTLGDHSGTPADGTSASSSLVVPAPFNP